MGNRTMWSLQNNIEISITSEEYLYLIYNNNYYILKYNHLYFDYKKITYILK